MNDDLETLRLDALTHDEFLVRSEALEFWSRESRVPDAATDRALDAIEIHGPGKAFRFFHQFTQLRHTPRSWAWLLGCLENVRDRLPGAATGDSLFHLTGWFLSGPVEWIERDRSRLFDTSSESPAPLDGLRELEGTTGLRNVSALLRIAAMDGTERRDLLDRRVTSAGRRPQFAHDEVRDIEALISEMVRRHELDAATVHQWLADFVDDPEADSSGYRAGAALLALTAARGDLELPTGLLLRVLAMDWDWHNELVERCFTASARPGDLRAVIDAWSDFEWFERLFLSTSLERRRFPELESPLLSLIGHDEGDADWMPQLRLGCAAVWYGSPGSLATARELAAATPDQGDGSTLHDALWFHEVITEGLTASAARRLRRMKEQHERIEQRMRMLAEGRLPGLETPAGRTIETQVREQPKVGRNDPCPCGSGKKFKKCCG